MNNVKLLDCTVRDGGYINDWNFGHDALIEIIQRLANAGIEYIEIGFLDERRPFDINRSIFPNTKSANEIYSLIDKKSSKLMGMIDYGTCDISNLQPKSETIIDGIRVIFKKEKMDGAMEFCRQVKELGYEVFSQLVSTTVYEASDYDRLAALANKIKPHAVSIVDTYGLMDNEELDSIFNNLDSRLDKDICIGFHAHNNLQLGYSNALSFINSHTCDRKLLVDGTLNGMGKGAGNAPIELLAFNFNKFRGTNYDINQLLEAVDSDVLKLFGKSNWGYSMKFYLATINRVHPNYVSDYIASNNLSVTDINMALKEISEEKKLYYDKKESFEALNKYRKSIEDKSNKSLDALRKLFTNRKMLLLGPGETLVGERKKIKRFIEDNKPIIISTNFLPKDYEADYVFVTNSRRLRSLMASLVNKQIIATSNLSEINKEFDYVVDNIPLIDNSVARDSAIIMILRLLSKLNVEGAYLAGFDGYKSSFEENFVSLSSGHGWQEPYPGFLNSYIREEIGKISFNLKVEFITTSMFYDEE